MVITSTLTTFTYGDTGGRSIPSRDSRECDSKATKIADSIGLSPSLQMIPMILSQLVADADLRAKYSDEHYEEEVEELFRQKFSNNLQVRRRIEGLNQEMELGRWSQCCQSLAREICGGAQRRKGLEFGQ